MITETEMTGLRVAYTLGETVARSYKPGNLFLGAFGEADKLGYTEAADRLTRSVFITAYLQNLPRPIVTTDAGLIIRIGKDA
jgi:hypothetical protein